MNDQRYSVEKKKTMLLVGCVLKLIFIVYLPSKMTQFQNVEPDKQIKLTNWYDFGTKVIMEQYEVSLVLTQYTINFLK